jgi:hypothetical protein
MDARIAQAEGDGSPSRTQRQVNDRRSGAALGERRSRGLILQHPGIERPDPVDKGRDPFDAMLGDQRGHAELGDQPHDDLQDVFGGLRIQLRGGLVEHERLGVDGKGGRDRDALSLAAGEGVDASAAQVVDADLIDHLLDALSHQRTGEAEVLHPKRKLGFDVVENELRVRVLEDETNVRPELARGMRARVEAARQDAATELAAGTVRDQPVEAPKQGRLPAPGRAPQQDHLARFDGGRHLDEGRPFGLRVSIADALKTDEWHDPSEQGWR